MKRHPSLIYLSRDHHHGLILAQIVKKEAPHYKGLPHDTPGKINYVVSFYENELKNHFDEEEKILFEFIKKKNEYFESAVNQLQEEHIKLSEYVFRLSNSKNPEADLNEFGILLEQHIRFEERELFEKIQTQFSEDELNQLSQKLNREDNPSKCIT
ncbi:MAG: hemerythrin domain-containing protein [Ignavibacteria bacterium]|nr:hemerythrin domain-containing protein [Ignavibacteria bacterium]